MPGPQRHKLNTEKFIVKARAIHGARYDYSQVVYQGIHKKVIVVCSEHGPWNCIPANHIREQSGCRKCFLDSFKGRKHPHWSGYGEITGSHWGTIRGGAAVRTLVFEISIQEAWDLFLKQDRKCTLTGWPLVMGGYKTRTASLDRIDSSVGYTSDNIQWLHKTVNIAKQSLSDQEFVTLCRAVADNSDRGLSQGSGA